jgi:hypothetical protein
LEQAFLHLTTTATGAHRIVHRDVT